MTVVLDTTVLIDVLRQHEAAIRYVSELAAVPACSEITRIEIIRGLRPEERRAAESLFEAIDWVPIDEPVARRAGDFGRSFRATHPGIDPADLAIAATAELHGGELATANVRHFPMFPGLRAPY